MDDFSVDVLFQHEQIFVAGDQQIRSGGFCQGKEIIVTGISTDRFNMRRAKQFGSPQKVAELIRLGWSDEVTEGRSFDDFDEFIDGGRRTNQDRRIEDRSDSGVSLRTSRTSASI